MTRRRVPVLLALLGALALPASAGAAVPAAPVITSVSPAHLGVGDVLTIRGRNFKVGRLTNLVVFQRVRARAIFVRADQASASRIQIRVPAKLLAFLTQRGGRPVATRFRLRVLARRFGLAFTPTRISPLIGPVGEGRTPSPPPISGETDCDHDGIPNSQETDMDNDLIPNDVERRIGTDPCNPDTDGDGIEDGYEYHAALDLNSRALPYAGKRPYPNPLDGSDANTDFDGDNMTQREEYAAFVRYSPHALTAQGRLPAYSDGDQTTQGQVPVPSGLGYLNTDSSCDVPLYSTPCAGRLYLTDDELDVDGDGIGNWDEIHGAFAAENVAHMAYKPLLDYLDPDTDGDTVPDGQDDQDHDDVSNVDEIQIASSGGYHTKHRFNDQVSNPMDPCSPDVNSRTCPLHPEN